MTKAAPTFYIFHGDDELKIEEEVEKMRARMGDTPNADLNTSEFDGTITDVAQITSAAMAYPFLADKRLVIVKDLLTWITRKGAGETGKKAVERLVNELPQLPDWARLVFVERDKLAENHKVVKLAQEHEHGFEKVFLLPKDATQWILKRAHDTYHAQIEPPAAAALASVTGNDLRRADNELLKLVAYVEGERAISERDVELLTPYVAEATTFQIIDAIAEGRGRQAFDLLSRLLGQQEDLFAIFGSINRQFRLLLLTKEYLAGGGSTKQIKDVLGVHPYTADKLAVQSRQFSLEQLEMIYRALQNYDVQMKTGKIEPELAATLLIAGLTR